jgi:hypothetical protein
MLTRRCCSSTARWSALDARQAGPAGGSIKHQSRSYETLTTAEIFSTSNPDHRGGPSAGTLQPADLARRNRLKSSSSQQLATYIEPESDDALRRAERRSPAAVFGARRMPRIAIPSELENKLERLVGRTYASLLPFLFGLSTLRWLLKPGHENLTWRGGQRPGSSACPPLALPPRFASPGS